MMRRSGLTRRLQAQREAERRQVQQARALTKAAKDAERARKADEQGRQLEQKERVRLSIEAGIAQAELQNEELEQVMAQLSSLLVESLAVEHFLDVQALKQPLPNPVFIPGPLAIAETLPDPQRYQPLAPTGLQKLLPGVKEKYAQEVARAQDAYRSDVARHAAREQERLRKLEQARVAFEQQVLQDYQRVREQYAEIDAFQRDLEAGSPEAIVNYFTIILGASSYPDGFPQHAKIAYVPESKQLVLEYDLPRFEIIPEMSAFKYVKAKDQITTTPRPITQRKTLYTSLVGQVTLRTLYELFDADRKRYIETLVLNGYVESIDKGIGHSVRTCLITLRTSSETFTSLDLSKVDPQTCLQRLNASVSKSPTELLPVRPVLEFSMVDSRFVEEMDVLSGLDQHPNLMELTPSEFESLITNLFQKMGLEARQTQASRDGGVDCVAFDPRPIFGGKVVIQAKRYKGTVGVSAVRDLYGTVMNEGASKGILITTSGYGQTSFDFAAGKPLELLSGSNLLHMLAEHGTEAKIEMIEEWRDPIAGA